MRIFGSLCDSLQEQVVTTSSNAKALWDHLKDLFHDNKDARAINLDNELRFIKIEKMYINEYCTKIKSMADRIKNLGCIVSEKNLVIYTVNGLDTWFATPVEIIRHRKTLPSFETARNMLLLKESSFNDQTDTSTMLKVVLRPQLFSWHSLHPTPKVAVTLNPNLKVSPNYAIILIKELVSLGTIENLSMLIGIGDLYPVTKPLTLLTFVSTSSTTWHQRLGHPRDEVLYSLTSRHFISCNKEKSKHVCHDCQLGKHAKLLFHTLNSIIKQCFDMIHSDLRTSLIHKFHANGTLSHYKARLVANGSSHQLGVDFDETFSPIVKLATILYMHEPLGFVDSQYPHHICLLQRSLYASSPVLLQQIIDSLHKEFDVSNLETLNYFLSISAVRHSTSLFLSQKKYALQLFERSHFISQLYRGAIVSHPDLSYAVQHICLYMHDPREPHFVALKRVMRYVKGIMDIDIPQVICVLLGDNLLSWSSKRQHTISRFSAETEYRGVANVVAETVLVRNLLCELHYPLMTMSANHVQHQRTKHIEIDIHFVRDMVKAGHVRVLHVPSRFQYANIFTKGLPSALFEDFCFSLSVRPPPAQTVMGVLACTYF
uniref:GAG-pre-integrase domain-containing protein n=1 Tax=Tanacetum cinerariifolium TaxID=118510 RepID=A0A6L2NIC2_TANCI|nr:hypothetical protein [Tanacetum cinerariifolium]